jgi:hypothetical protein
MEQSIWNGMQPVRDWHGVDSLTFSREVEPLNRPAVLRNLVAGWPAVVKAKESPQALADYLRGRCNDRPVNAMVGDPAIRGRFFYSDDLTGFNFAQQRVPLGQMIGYLLQELANPQAPAVYAGAVPVAEHAPALMAEHSLALLPDNVPRQTSIWIGNRTRVAAHWDPQHNIAGVISGRRRYTLFPTHQIKNLYVGPLDRAPAGVPISLVDFQKPDFERFPRFREALAHAEVAELGPGDALYMPALWVHHAESLDGFGLMMNFWWQTWPIDQLSPYLSMLHALLTVRELPSSVRDAWRELFDLYVFEKAGPPLAHIPDQVRGMFGTSTPQRTLAIIGHLQQSLEHLRASRAAGSLQQTPPPRP